CSTLTLDLCFSYILLGSLEHLEPLQTRSTSGFLCPISIGECGMPRIRLTDVTISKLPLSKARVTYWDEGMPAFGVRVGAGRKAFVVIVRPGQRIKLGNYPYVTLKDARQAAYGWLKDRNGKSAAEEAPAAGEVVKQFIEIRHAQSR